MAAEKNEFELIELIKNFEFSISQLNDSLFIKEKKEYKIATSQTDSQKPAMLTFLKQLVADFESYDGNEQDRIEIENELRNYSEIEMLNCPLTKMANYQERQMTLKEMLFSFFEYSKQKAISIAYHRKEMNRIRVGNKNNDYGTIDSKRAKDDSSRSNILESLRLGAKYDRKNSLNSEGDSSSFREKKQNIVADIASKLPQELSEGQEDEILNFRTIMQKHDDINESGLLRNVEQKTKYMLPIIVDENGITASNKKRNRTPSRMSAYIDIGTSNKNSPRQPKKSARRNERFTQTGGVNTSDAFTMTMGESLAEELDRLIKTEAAKTIQMLEMFMKIHKDSPKAITNGNEQESESLDKAKNDIFNSILQITKEQENEDLSTHEHNFTEDDDLFSGMDNTYQTLQINKYKKNNDNRNPFSKYVEE